MIDEQDELYEIVGQEMKNGQKRPGLVARAIAEARGNREKARALYIRYRVAELAADLRRQKVQDLLNQNLTAHSCQQILTLLGFKVSTDISGKYTVQGKTGATLVLSCPEDFRDYTRNTATSILASPSFDFPKSPPAPSDKPHQQFAVPARTVSSAPKSTNRQSATHSEPKTSDQTVFDEAPSALDLWWKAGQPPAEEQWGDPFKKKYNSTMSPREAHPSPARFKNLTTLAKWLRVLLILGLFVTLISAWSDWLEIELLTNAKQGILPSEATAEANDERQLILAFVEFPLFILTGILFLIWIHRANSNARSWGAQGMQFTPGWAVGWYFIPIANIWKPYQAMREIWKASVYSSADWHLKPTGPLVKWWWIFWLINGLFGSMAMKAMLKAEGLDQFAITALVAGLDIAANLASIPLYITAIFLVAKITEAQVQRVG